MLGCGNSLTSHSSHCIFHRFLLVAVACCVAKHYIRYFTFVSCKSRFIVAEGKYSCATPEQKQSNKSLRKSTGKPNYLLIETTTIRPVRAVRVSRYTRQNGTPVLFLLEQFQCQPALRQHAACLAAGEHHIAAGSTQHIFCEWSTIRTRIQRQPGRQHLGHRWHCR